MSKVGPPNEPSCSPRYGYHKAPSQIPISLMDPLQLFEIVSEPEIWHFAGLHQGIVHRLGHLRLEPYTLGLIGTRSLRVVGFEQFPTIPQAHLPAASSIF